MLEQTIDLRTPKEDQLWSLPTLAAAYAHPCGWAGLSDARKTVTMLLARKPEYSTSVSVSRLFPYRTKELNDRYVNALRRAGLPE